MKANTTLFLLLIFFPCIQSFCQADKGQYLIMDGDSTNFEKYGSNYEPATVDVSPTVGVYLSKRFRCPEEAKKNQVVGNIVVSFTIDTTGTLINPVVKRGLRYGCDEEAIRLIKTLPKWKPAMKNNHPVEHKGEVRILVRCEE